MSTFVLKCPTPLCDIVKSAKKYNELALWEKIPARLFLCLKVGGERDAKKTKTTVQLSWMPRAY